MGAPHEQARGEVSDELAQAEELEELAEAEARGDVESPQLHPTRGNGRSEVFSVRLPEAAAAELRRRAEAEGVSAGALLRQWALASVLSTVEPTSLVWRMSSHSSSAVQQHVEVAAVLTGSVTIRDTKDPAGPTLRFTLAEWSAFLQGVRDGEFDLQNAFGVPSRQRAS